MEDGVPRGQHQLPASRPSTRVLAGVLAWMTRLHGVIKGHWSVRRPSDLGARLTAERIESLSLKLFTLSRNKCHWLRVTAFAAGFPYPGQAVSFPAVLNKCPFCKWKGQTPPHLPHKAAVVWAVGRGSCLRSGAASWLPPPSPSTALGQR